MRWTLGILLAALVIFGCEEEDADNSIRIELAVAPTRLPYAEDLYHSNGWDTTDVKFVVRLHGDLTDVDTVICGIYDDLGGKVDSFHLFDDGDSVLHWSNTLCENEHSRDALANDGYYTRLIRPANVITNYAGARYQFRFSALKYGSSVARADHWAESWAPTYELLSIELMPELIPPCSDSMRITLNLRRDSTDSIESVVVGFPGFWGGSHSILGNFVPLSGDSIWRVAVSHDVDNWSEMAYDGLQIEVRGRLGMSRLMVLSPYYTVPIPEANLDATPDSFQVSTHSVADTFWIKANILLCPNRVPDRVSADLLNFIVPEHWAVAFSYYDMNDCGMIGDFAANDGMHTTYALVTADESAQPFTVSIRIKAGVTAHPDPCLYDPDRVSETSFSKIVTFLPPQ